MSSELIKQIVATHGYPMVTEETLATFLSAQEHSVLFFTEDPKQYPESNDVAVILPELCRQFPGRFQVGVVERDSEHRLHRRFPFDSWPALVFMRHDQYLGAISRVQDWGVYQGEIARLLNAAPLHKGDLGIPVLAAMAIGAQTQ